MALAHHLPPVEYLHPQLIEQPLAFHPKLSPDVSCLVFQNNQTLRLLQHALLQPLRLLGVVRVVDANFLSVAPLFVGLLKLFVDVDQLAQLLDIVILVFKEWQDLARQQLMLEFCIRLLLLECIPESLQHQPQVLYFVGGHFGVEGLDFLLHFYRQVGKRAESTL